MFRNIDADQRTVRSVFERHCIFITGSTGFLGKVLLEKIMRTCPRVAKVFILIRKKDGYRPDVRFQEELANIKLFDECHPLDMQTKIYIVEGDVTKPDFDIHSIYKEKMFKEVDYVFHCAASVRFKDDPRTMLKINFMGVKHLINLCHKMTNLKAVIHVSTAYSFCNRRTIGEQVYPEDIELRDLETMINLWSDKDLDKKCKELARSRPSLYQYSKAMAEVYIAKNAGELPVVIVRPSIITAIAEDPFPGWVDNINGPSGFISLSSKGILKTLHVKPGINADWVPVDLVANTLMVAAYHKTMVDNSPNALLMPLFKKCGNVAVVNCVCPHTNAITWSEVIEICIPLLQKYPSIKVTRVPGGIITSSAFIHQLCRYFYHYLPALILDIGLILRREKPIYVAKYQRMHNALDFMQHYTVNEFRFHSANMNLLAESLLSEDKRIFPIDQNNLNWHEYLENYVRGVRRYHSKEEDSTLEAALQKLERIRYWVKVAKLLPLAIGVPVATVIIIKKRNIDFLGSSILACRQAIGNICVRSSDGFGLLTWVPYFK